MSKTIMVTLTEPQMDALLGALSRGIDEWEASINDDDGSADSGNLRCANRAWVKLFDAWHAKSQR
tara:strand:+ start:1419 stop:1613 length:195 start_codon:yes stop_codon:yes gene_type:complete